MFCRGSDSSAYAAPHQSSNMKEADINRLVKLIRKSDSVLDMELDPLHVVAERRMLSKLFSVVDNTS